jgi:uncharacterized phage-associated protein
MKAYHTYSAIDVAYVLIKQASKEGKRFSNLHLQKLVYVCHGLSLAYFDRPLILEDVHAWKHGPVVPSVYFNFKPYGSEAITAFSEDIQLDAESAEIVCSVVSTLGHFTAWQLVDLTHREGSPWSQVWAQDGKIRVIPDAVIKNHYLTIKETGVTSCL